MHFVHLFHYILLNCLLLCSFCLQFQLELRLRRNSSRFFLVQNSFVFIDDLLLQVLHYLLSALVKDLVQVMSLILSLSLLTLLSLKANLGQSVVLPILCQETFSPLSPRNRFESRLPARCE